MKTTLTLATLGLTASIASAALVAQKTYDSGDFGFSNGPSLNASADGSSKIDGANSLKLQEDTDPTQYSYANYYTDSTYNSPGQIVTVHFKFRADYGVTSSSVDSRKNLLGFAVKDGSGADILVFKFEEGKNHILLNDGGGDFERTGVGFTQGDIYEFSFTTEIGDSGKKYSYTINSGSSGSDSGSDYTLSRGEVDSFGQVAFFMNGDGTGSSASAYADSITVDVTPVPEPSSSALLALGGLAMAFRRRK